MANVGRMLKEPILNTIFKEADRGMGCALERRAPLPRALSTYQRRRARGARCSRVKEETSGEVQRRDDGETFARSFCFCARR